MKELWPGVSRLLLIGGGPVVVAGLIVLFIL